MEIKYDKKIFKVLKNCSHIANMIAVQNKGDKNLIFHKNAGMSFRLITDKEMFDAGDYDVAFNDFKEFYDIIDVFKDTPTISIDDTNIAKIKSGEVEINYTMGDYEIVDMVTADIKLEAVQGEIELSADKLAEIKKFAGLMGMTSDSSRPRIEIVAFNSKIKLIFKNELSNDKLEYEFDNVSETPDDFTESANVSALLDLPNANYTIKFSTKNIRLIQFSANVEDYDLDFFAGYKG